MFLENNALYFALSLSKKDEQKQRYALLNIPSANVARFQFFGDDGAHFTILFLDDMIRQHMQLIFPGYEINACFSIKLTRDAEIDLVEDLDTDVADAVEHMIAERDLGAPTRFLFEKSMPKEMQQFLAEYFQLGKKEMINGGRYHNLKDFSGFLIPSGAA